MDARSLRRMTFDNKVITGGSHAPEQSYARPSAGPPRRRTAPANPPPVPRLQAEDLSRRPLVAVAGRRRPHHLAVRRLRAARRCPLRRDGPQGAAGDAPRLRRTATAAQRGTGRELARGAAPTAP